MTREAIPPASAPGTIVISDWSPDWPRQFTIRAETLRGALGGLALRIDHIGSTSIRGMAAKPIIDIQVSVTDFEPIEQIVEPMGRAGYEWRQSNPELTKRYFRERPNDARTHIHVRRLGSWHEQWALLFRDYMRAHAEEHAAYASLKRQLAARFGHNLSGYTEAKVDHFWAIIRREDSWAWSVGWQPGPSDA